MSNWYRKVVNDMEAIPACISHFEQELENARLELSLKGKTLEKNQAELPGVMEMRFTQLQEIESILEHLNIKLKELRSSTFKKFLESYNKALSSRDAEKYVDSEVEVVNMMILVNEVALLRNKYLSISKGLEQKAWMMGHITKLRCAGLDDIKVT